jgi:hypothetical protein
MVSRVSGFELRLRGMPRCYAVLGHICGCLQVSGLFHFIIASISFFFGYVSPVWLQSLVITASHVATTALLEEVMERAALAKRLLCGSQLGYSSHVFSQKHTLIRIAPKR